MQLLIPTFLINECQKFKFKQKGKIYLFSIKILYFCKVKSGVDTTTGKPCAIKIMNPDMDEQATKLVMTEMDTMAKLEHPNVLSVLEFGMEKYVKNTVNEKDVFFIALELAAGGELFDFVTISGRFSESLARYFFR